MARSSDAEFIEFVIGSHQRLVQLAYLLCGDWHRAEDAVQSAFVRMYAAWPRIRSRAAVDLYARKAVLSTVRDDARRPWRRERVSARLPEQVSQDRSGRVDERLLLVSALRMLPTRQRTAVVLRYLADLSIGDTAEVMGCSPGTVKSQTARAITALRKSFTDVGLNLQDPDATNLPTPEGTRPWH
ncbi:MAG TPA: SigE family RNA polymerase sigma factor [Actinomycetes bacterium]|nr:SigE family RNA polymerase sigma factor [Actinomycetes bacterium]